MSDMPDWPAAMNAKMAALYVGELAPSTFYALGLPARRHTKKGDT